MSESCIPYSSFVPKRQDYPLLCDLLLPDTTTGPTTNISTELSSLRRDSQEPSPVHQFFKTTLANIHHAFSKLSVSKESIHHRSSCETGVPSNEQIALFNEAQQWLMGLKRDLIHATSDELYPYQVHILAYMERLGTYLRSILVILLPHFIIQLFMDVWTLLSFRIMDTFYVLGICKKFMNELFIHPITISKTVSEKCFDIKCMMAILDGLGLHGQSIYASLFSFYVRLLKDDHVEIKIISVNALWQLFVLIQKPIAIDHDVQMSTFQKRVKNILSKPMDGTLLIPLLNCMAAFIQKHVTFVNMEEWITMAFKQIIETLSLNKEDLETAFDAIGRMLYFHSLSLALSLPLHSKAVPALPNNSNPASNPPLQHRRKSGLVDFFVIVKIHHFEASLNFLMSLLKAPEATALLLAHGEHVRHLFSIYFKLLGDAWVYEHFVRILPSLLHHHEHLLQGHHTTTSSLEGTLVYHILHDLIMRHLSNTDPAANLGVATVCNLLNMPPFAFNQKTLLLFKMLLCFVDNSKLYLSTSSKEYVLATLLQFSKTTPKEEIEWRFCIDQIYDTMFETLILLVAGEGEMTVVEGKGETPKHEYQNLLELSLEIYCDTFKRQVSEHVLYPASQLNFILRDILGLLDYYKSHALRLRETQYMRLFHLAMDLLTDPVSTMEKEKLHDAMNSIQMGLKLLIQVMKFSNDLVFFMSLHDILKKIDIVIRATTTVEIEKDITLDITLLVMDILMNILQRKTPVEDTVKQEIKENIIQFSKLIIDFLKQNKRIDLFEHGVDLCGRLLRLEQEDLLTQVDPELPHEMYEICCHVLAKYVLSEQSIQMCHKTMLLVLKDQSEEAVLLFTHSLISQYEDTNDASLMTSKLSIVPRILSDYFRSRSSIVLDNVIEWRALLKRFLSLNLYTTYSRDHQACIHDMVIECVEILLLKQDVNILHDLFHDASLPFMHKSQSSSFQGFILSLVLCLLKRKEANLVVHQSGGDFGDFFNVLIKNVQESITTRQPQAKVMKLILGIFQALLSLDNGKYKRQEIVSTLRMMVAQGPKPNNIQRSILIDHTDEEASYPFQLFPHHIKVTSHYSKGRKGIEKELVKTISMLDLKDDPMLYHYITFKLITVKDILASHPSRSTILTINYKLEGSFSRVLENKERDAFHLAPYLVNYYICNWRHYDSKDQPFILEKLISKTNDWRLSKHEVKKLMNQLGRFLTSHWNSFAFCIKKEVILRLFAAYEHYMLSETAAMIQTLCLLELESLHSGLSQVSESQNEALIKTLEVYAFWRDFLQAILTQKAYTFIPSHAQASSPALKVSDIPSSSTKTSHTHHHHDLADEESISLQQRPLAATVSHSSGLIFASASVQPHMAQLSLDIFAVVISSLKDDALWRNLLTISSKFLQDCLASGIQLCIQYSRNSLDQFLRLQGYVLALLEACLMRLSRLEDPQYPGHYLIELYQSQLSTVFTQILAVTGLSNLDTCLKILRDYLALPLHAGDPKRLQRPLKVFLNHTFSFSSSSFPPLEAMSAYPMVMVTLEDLIRLKHAMSFVLWCYTSVGSSSPMNEDTRGDAIPTTSIIATALKAALEPYLSPYYVYIKTVLRHYARLYNLNMCLSRAELDIEWMRLKEESPETYIQLDVIVAEVETHLSDYLRVLSLFLDGTTPMTITATEIEPDVGLVEWLLPLSVQLLNDRQSNSPTNDKVTILALLELCKNLLRIKVSADPLSSLCTTSSLVLNE